MTTMHAPLTSGRTLRSWDGGWFGAVESLHPPGQVVPSHAHANPDITILRSGGYETGRRSRRHSCKPGTALFLPGGYEHDDRFADCETHMLIIELREPRWEQLGRRVVPPSVTSLLVGPLIERCARRIASALTGSGPSAISGAEEALVDLLGPLVQCDDALHDGRRPHWIVNACDEIRASFRTGVRLSRLAERVNRHPVHFARAFRSYMGCSVGGFVYRLRVEAACDVLKETNDSLASVAASLGFYDQAQFSRVFRRLIGVSPGQFRRAAMAGTS